MVLAVCLAACQKEITTASQPTPTAALPEHLTLGNLSGVTTDAAQPTNYLLPKPQYALSYHRDQGKPNWVNWHLGTADLGNAARQDDFRADADLPSGWYQVKPSVVKQIGQNLQLGRTAASLRLFLYIIILYILTIKIIYLIFIYTSLSDGVKRSVRLSFRATLPLYVWLISSV